ncbi:MAG TPA: diguanylate cyclase, partial [Halanaerobiales bacterium]|nr:diguanylate cyclase [Halanaerobiales bacterium]
KMDKIPELPDLTDNYLPLKNSAGYWFALKANNRKKGLILVDNLFSLYKIPERVIDIMQILCSHLATAIENIRLLSSLKKAVYYDKLTGLYNRRYFERILPKFSNQIPTSIIMGDVNGLKITNDVFGHKEGDKLLKVVADILRKACRKDDIIVRWGGDEFVILLPQTDNNEVKKIIDKIKIFCSKDFGTSVKISISLGSATRDKNEINIKETISEAENCMYRQKLLESREFRKSLISSLKNTLIEKCYENEGHIERMVKLSTMLGNHLGLSGNELENLRLLAMLHDIGKVAVDSSILNKKDSLNKEEWEEVKKHPEAGYRIVQASFELSHIAYDILCHHERWDRQGYPLQKAGVEIPFLARIISVVDAYDIMTHKQPYKEALSPNKALKELRKNAGSQFDPDIVEAFCEILENNNFI